MPFKTRRTKLAALGHRLRFDESGRVVYESDVVPPGEEADPPAGRAGNNSQERGQQPIIAPEKLDYLSRDLVKTLVGVCAILATQALLALTLP